MTPPRWWASARFLPALAIAAALLNSACGGAGDPEVTVVLQADTSGLTPGLSSAALFDSTAATLRQRAQFYGLEDPEISAVRDLFTITVKGVDEATAGELFSRRGLLEFRQPRVVGQGFVICRGADGAEFGVPPQNVNPDDASRSPARCFSRDKIGDPVWDPAAAGDAQLTDESVAAGGWTLREDVPFLSVRFTSDGAPLLETITRNLVGYPLGIFLDGELIAAPRIQRPITEAEAVISGFDLGRARLFHAVLNSGPLALPLTVSPGTPTP